MAATVESIVEAVGHRLRQGLRGLRPAPIPSGGDDLLRSLLSPRQRAAFLGLPRFDQAQLCDVALRLTVHGVSDRDTLTAAILHDIGKADARGRVRLADRTTRVLLRAAAPALLRRLAVIPGPRWLHGLALCVHHPRLRADLARELGCTERTCWLIRHHEDDPAPDDPDLRLLIAADRGSGFQPQR
ncbi:MAG: hypothetical protein ACR2OO_04200 [Thermomicrobiales bacterium]